MGVEFRANGWVNVTQDAVAEVPFSLTVNEGSPGFVEVTENEISPFPFVVNGLPLIELELSELVTVTDDWLSSALPLLVN